MKVMIVTELDKATSLYTALTILRASEVRGFKTREQATNWADKVLPKTFCNPYYRIKKEHNMTKVNLNTRILNALAVRAQAVYELSADGFGTPSTIRKALTRLRREGKVGVVEKRDLGLGRGEKIWSVVGNNAAVA